TGVAPSVDSGASAPDYVTNTAAQTITATLGAALAAGDVLGGSLDNGATWAPITGMVNGTAISWTGATLLGSSSIVFRVTDLAGNVGGRTGTSAYVLDTTAPAIAVTGVALSVDSGASAFDHTTDTAAQTITAMLSAALAAGDVLEGSLDNGASWTPITSMVNGTAISWTGATLVGSSSIAFRVTDRAGNTGSTNGATAYVLDTTAPMLTVGAITLSLDTGTSNADHITRIAAQTITATLSAALAAGDILQGSLDNGASWTPITGMVSGTAISWTGATLVDSSSIAFRLIDLAGNIGSMTGTTAYVLDTTAPVLSVTGVALSADTGTSAIDFKTNTAAQTITATLSAALTAGDVLSGSLDNGASWTPITSMVNGTAISWTGATLAGSSIVFRVTDLAGNVGSRTGTTAYVLDTTAPVLTVSAVTLSVDSGASAVDHTTNPAAQVISATLSAALAAGDVLEGSLDNGASWTPITSMVNGTAISWTGATLVGSSSIVFRVTDLAGNAGSSTGATAYVLDTTAPVLTVSAITLGLDTGTSNTDRTTKTAAQTISATLSAALSAGDILSGSLDNGVSWVDVTGMVTGTAVSWTGATLVGSSSIAFRVTDLAGNIGVTTGTTAYLLDTTVPAAPTMALVTDSGASSSDRITNSAAFSVGALEVASASASGFSYLQYQLDGTAGAWLSGAPGVTGVTSAMLAGTADGAHTVYVRQVDLAGNISAAGSQALTLDTSAPVVTSVAISGVPSGSNTALVAGDSMSVSVVMSEAVTITGIPTYTLTLDSGPRLATYVSGSGSNTLVFGYTVAAGDSDLSGGVTAAAGALLANGASLVDLAGNQASLAVAAIAANANIMRIDTAAAALVNAAILDGQGSLDVTSNLVLDFGKAVRAASAGTISLVNDANTAGKAGFYGEATTHTIDLHFGARSSSNGTTTVQTYSSATTQNASTLTGTLSIVDATGVITINPLHDLDLANNYHVEIAANSFTGTANGLGNAAFGALTGGAYALDFATVSPGAAGSGSAAVAMTGAAALTAGHTWIDITGLGDVTVGTVTSVASAVGATAYVIANQNTDPLDTVIVADTTNVLLAAFRAGDMLYVDNTVNGRTSSLGSGSLDVSWSANATNDGVLLDLPAHVSFDAFIAMQVTPFADVAALNLRIDTLVSSQQIIVG
ncbi:MAG: hypothetical protein H7335_09875, partial [Massilia sp.]|nr:hypothetical protein [Massilia sp.]